MPWRVPRLSTSRDLRDIVIILQRSGARVGWPGYREAAARYSDDANRERLCAEPRRAFQRGAPMKGGVSATLAR
jgi:hypothetical protein